jgi:acetyl-CoA carboxylase biotin carboxyl carrier protein
MENGRLKEIMEMMREFGVAELKLEDGEERLLLRRESAMAQRQPVAVAAAAPAPLPVAPGPAQLAPAPAAAAAPAGHTVKSPMVGTFYAAPKPGAPNFVKVGDKVEVGTVLCIIEAMKLMNEIESDRAGTVVEIVAENAKPVQFGQPLFRIS